MASPIPVVSFGKFRTGTKQDQQDVAQQVYDAFSTVGFIYLKDCGIPQSRVDDIFGLVSCYICTGSVIRYTHTVQCHPCPHCIYPRTKPMTDVSQGQTVL